MNEGKAQICEICGGAVPKIGSWVQCSTLSGMVCMNCCWHCLYHRVAGSVVWCAAAYDRQTKK